MLARRRVARAECVAFLALRRLQPHSTTLLSATSSARPVAVQGRPGNCQGHRPSASCNVAALLAQLFANKTPFYLHASRSVLLRWGDDLTLPRLAAVPLPAWLDLPPRRPRPNFNLLTYRFRD
jgi:hypothetical protein